MRSYAYLYQLIEKTIKLKDIGHEDLPDLVITPQHRSYETIEGAVLSGGFGVDVGIHSIFNLPPLLALPCVIAVIFTTMGGLLVTADKFPEAAQLKTLLQEITHISVNCLTTALQKIDHTDVIIDAKEDKAAQPPKPARNYHELAIKLVKAPSLLHDEKFMRTSINQLKSDPIVKKDWQEHRFLQKLFDTHIICYNNHGVHRSFRLAQFIKRTDLPKEVRKLADPTQETQQNKLMECYTPINHYGKRKEELYLDFPRLTK